MSTLYGPSSIATPGSTGLILKVDASDSASYTGSGTTFTDLSGSGNNMTIAGTTFTRAGGLGYFTFAGSSTADRIYKTAFSHPLTTASHEIWIWPEAGYVNVATQYYISYEGTGAGNSNNFLIGVPLNTNFLVTSTSGGFIGGALTLSAWNHVVGTSNRTTGENKLYINGTCVNTFTVNAGTNFYSGGILMLGQEQDGDGGGTTTGLDPLQSFKGRISAYSVWNKVLTPKEVTNLYLSNKSRFGL